MTILAIFKHEANTYSLRLAQPHVEISSLYQLSRFWVQVLELSPVGSLQMRKLSQIWRQYGSALSLGHHPGLPGPSQSLISLLLLNHPACQQPECCHTSYVLSLCLHSFLMMLYLIFIFSCVLLSWFLFALFLFLFLFYFWFLINHPESLLKSG